MPSVFKAAEKQNKGKKRAAEEEPAAQQVEKKRKDKVLLLSSRGVTQRMRHLMMDLEALLPHTKKGELEDSGQYRDYWDGGAGIGDSVSVIAWLAWLFWDDSNSSPREQLDAASRP